jgi:hypothetical protein
LSNEAFASAGLAVRVDHRSLRVQGIDREPQPKIPFAAMQMERRGLRSEVADRIRQRWRERVREREDRSAAPDLETVRRQGREAWLALREQAAAAPLAVASAVGLKQPQTAHIKEAAADQRRSDVELALDRADRDFGL